MSSNTVTVRVDLDFDEMERAGLELADVADDFDEIDENMVYFEYEGVSVDEAIQQAQDDAEEVLVEYVSEQEARYIANGGRAWENDE